jgi:hypothetical protein
MDEDFWESVQEREYTPRSARTGVFNIALLFGTAAIALALIVPPMLTGNPDKKRLAFEADQYDNITTGSIGTSPGENKRYTIRRSVLQETPGSVCIVDGYEGGVGC